MSTFLLLLTGELAQDVLVWRTGMGGWQNAATITEFAELPPPLPNRIAPQATSLTEVTVPMAVAGPREEPRPPNISTRPQVDNQPPAPWRRFFARTFDMAWICLLLSVTFYALVNHLINNDVITNQLHLQYMFVLFILLIQPAAMLVDAAVTHLFTNSLGKALLGLSVYNADGKKPVFSSLLYRNMHVMFYGMGLSIPIVSVITNIYQLIRLKGHGSTTYDSGKFVVIASKKFDPIPFIVFSIILTAFYSSLI